MAEPHGIAGPHPPRARRVSAWLVAASVLAILAGIWLVWALGGSLIPHEEGGRDADDGAHVRASPTGERRTASSWRRGTGSTVPGASGAWWVSATPPG